MIRMLLFYFFTAIVILLGVLSLLSRHSFLSYVRRELAGPLPDYTPFVSIIAPCRGLEDGLRQNLEALCKQSYPAFEIIFVTDRADDPSLKVIDEVIAAYETSPCSTQVVIAGEARDSGQKVHNLSSGSFES